MLAHWLADVFYPFGSFFADMFHHDGTNTEYGHTLLLIAGKTSLIYFFLILGLRLLGKRELGQMNIYDLVLIIILGNAVQNAMVGDDNTLTGGLVGATTLLILNRLFTIAMARSKRLEKLMVGEPLLILNDGKLVEECMRKEGVTREQVLAALREHGLDQLEEAHMCVLEVDGTISVVANDAKVQRTKKHYRALRLP
ncbi:MAG TPA: YetF domain-containing protein [Chthonomonadaceae bacterium]|nr:YetF domain-containing protein [Chthonomonadaceae bacterium]